MKDSLTPHFDLSPTAKYGLKWWLHPYGKDNSMMAWAGSGFGGQRPIVLPEYDIVAVYTAWNIGTYNGPVLRGKDAIDRLVGLVADKR